MRFLNVFFIILFLASALLQYNDPDPFIWIPLYFFGALICYLALKKKRIPALYYLGFLIYLPFAVYLLVKEGGVLSWYNEHGAENIAQSMKATKPWVEETREFFGLLLLIAALVINWIRLRRKEQTNMQISPS